MPMSTTDMIRMALRNLWKRKLRTFLTILGVVIGTASIVVMVSIGIGMNEGFKQQVEEWGSLQVINVNAPGGGRQESMMGAEGSSSGASKIKKEVIINTAAIEEFKKIPGVDTATPAITEYVFLSCGKFVTDAEVYGIYPESMEAMGYKAEDGRVLKEGDSKQVVLGGSVAKSFYNPKLNWSMRYNSPPPEVDVINEKAVISYDSNLGTRHADKKIKPIKVEIVGVMSESGNDSYSIFMPLKEVEKIKVEKEKTEQAQNEGSSARNKQKPKKGIYEKAMVKASSMEQVKEIQDTIKEMGYEAFSLTDELETMKETTKMLRVMLGAIGAISLIVAAIGITNTMVMAIYERTREIGVMKVIGASLMDIKKLFLTEAAFIGFAGGAFGVLISLGTSKIVNIIAMKQDSNMLSSIPLWLCVASLLFATFIGVASGYLPAQRAMKLSALSAIKTE